MIMQSKTNKWPQSILQVTIVLKYQEQRYHAIDKFVVMVAKMIWYKHRHPQHDKHSTNNVDYQWEGLGIAKGKYFVILKRTRNLLQFDFATGRPLPPGCYQQLQACEQPAITFATKTRLWHQKNIWGQHVASGICGTLFTTWISICKH